ncbi:hypothetical protein J2W40_001732 [Sphingobium xenophagum]|uniref:GmrSD restriction endonucleases N-terminal domain-containing protein n=1 Tax=Sphingobium xenophagum TaxID=121428 RepID=A0ABU1X0T9_SPHXE|nr:DUF262 domain-containing protein [Sphingobium xenophagum]MDR7154914.1 hypothetical protein [Sphingobium xenophagum]
MRTTAGHLSIAEIRDQMESEVLKANPIYQRSAGLWPVSAKSYFIDTILNTYPFSSVYIHERLSLKTNKISKDIVDGQQRLTTIFEFLGDKFTLSSSSKEYRGQKFSEMDNDVKERILSYSVPVVTIFSPDQNEILEMFRRMNAFTVPLNPAEQRHSQFHGEFKWFVNGVADEFSPMLNRFGVLTQKQIIRMSDAEFIADLVDTIARGIQHREPTSFTKLYKENDEEFPRLSEMTEKVYESLRFIMNNFPDISGTFATKSYAFHSLISAMVHNFWGIPNGESDLEMMPTGRFCNDVYLANQGILALAAAHESKDEVGPYGPYVKACLKATNRKAQRVDRTRFLLMALNGKLPV